MTLQDIKSLLPMVILAGGILFTMILIAVKRNHRLAFIATLLILAGSITASLAQTGDKSHAIGEIAVVDHFGIFYQVLLLSATFAVSVFSYISLERFFPHKRKEEYYVLLMLATLGAGMLAVSTHFIVFFVSIELLTISLYTLISYYRDQVKAIEAGLKYLVLAAMSSAFMLFGMALIYAISGSLSFTGLSAIIPPLNPSGIYMLVAGVGLIMVGIGFKLALVPFHMWAPDVYEGASAPVSAFIASVSKGSVVAVLLRLFMMADLYRYENVMLAVTIIAILSMLMGNLLALMQKNVKRILAYSSIAHLGYLLVAFISGRGMGIQAATFYITIYMITVIGAFGMISVIAPLDESAKLENFKGLFWKKPFPAALFTIFLLSLAGIPLTAGFMGKYFLLTAGLGRAQWPLAFVLIISSVIGLFYYLRVIVAMMKPDEDTVPVSPSSLHPSFVGILMLTFLGTLVIALGICPGWLIEFVKTLNP